MRRPVALEHQSPPGLSAIDRRDSQLWIVSCIIIAAFSAGFLVLHLAGGVESGRTWERQALIGQSCLILLTFAYFIQKRRELRRERMRRIQHMLESEWLRERNEAVGTALDVLSQLGRQNTEERIAEEVSSGTVASLRADRCLVMIREERAKVSLRADSEPSPKDECLARAADHVITTGDPLLIDPESGDGSEVAAALATPKGRAIVGAPLVVKGRIAGAIVAETDLVGSDARFGDWDGQIVQVIARATSAAIENIRLTARVTHRRDQLRRSLHRLRLAQPGVILGERLKAMEELVDRVAHFIANPLTTISGYAQLMGRSDIDESTRRSLATIEEEVERCHQALNDLKAFAHRPPAEPRLTDLNQLLRQALSLKANRFNRIHLDVSFRPHDELEHVVVDPVQLQQVFFSVLADIEASVADADLHELIVETEARDERLRIHFHVTPVDPDSGVAHRPWIPFATGGAHDEPTQLARGIVNAVVRAHGGATRTRLNAERGTTRFTVELPQLAPPAPPPTSIDDAPVLHAEPKPTAVARVLIVDDEERIVRLIERVLRNEGFEVVCLHDGQEALNVLKDDDFDVIILDYHLPTVDGSEIANYLAAERPELAARVVLATGDEQSPELVATARRLGVPTLGKPFQIKRMIEAVNAVAHRVPHPA